VPLHPARQNHRLEGIEEDGEYQHSPGNGGKDVHVRLG
jgi:hypothetical protein